MGVVNHSPSARILFLGVLVSNLVVLAASFVGVVVLIGALLYPRSIGLFITLPYYSYVVFLRPQERIGDGHWPSFSKNFFVLRIMRQYLGLEIKAPPKELQEVATKENARLVIGIFPHGSYTDFRIVMDGVLIDTFPDISILSLAATVLFRLPLVRELALWSGCVDARRSIAEKMLDEGHSLLVLPGGEKEQLNTEYGKEKVYVKKRRGFVRLAMRKGVPVVPAYAFGVSDYYYTSNFLFGLRKWLVTTFGVCIPLTAGYMGLPMSPRPVKTTIVLGKPLVFQMKEKGNPTSEEVDQAHAKFIQALEELFDEHKTSLGYGDRKLQVE